jgi:MscS family membrane protein
MTAAALNRWAADFYGYWSGAIFAFVIIFIVLAANAVLHRVLTAVARRVDAKGRLWEEAFFSAASPPARGVVWVVGLSVAVGLLDRGGKLSLLSQIFPLARSIAIIALAAWFLLRVARRVEHNIRARAARMGHELDPTALDAIGKLVRASILITAALVALQTLGFSISGLLAFGGIGGIAVGFAAQGLVANLFGGLTVYASRPFKVGESIIMPEHNVMGEVQEIGWRATRIMGFDRKPFFVPNSLFNTAVLINHSRMTNRQITEYLQLRYSDIDKVEAIVKDANAMLARHPGIDRSNYVFRFDTCGDFALKLYFYAFTITTVYSDYMETKEDLLLRIVRIVHDHGAELAVPVSTVHVPEGLRLRGENRAIPPDAVLAGQTPPPTPGHD